MTEVIDWGQFGSGQFVKFATVGDSVTGVITGLRVGQDFNGAPCPVIDVDTAGGPQTISCGQAALKATVRDLGAKGEVRVGRTIAVTYTGDTKAEKGMKKVFSVVLSDAPGSDKPPF
jgi:hypothetical protein